MNPKRRRAHDRLAALPGVRPVRRPVSPSDPTSSTSTTCAPGASRASAGDQSREVREWRRCAVRGLAPAGRPPASTSSWSSTAASGCPATRAGADLPAAGVDHRPGSRRYRRGTGRRAGRQGGHLRHVVRHLPGRGVGRAAPGSGARDGARFAAAVAPTTSPRCARPPGGCCGTATEPETARAGPQGAPAGRRRRADAGGRGAGGWAVRPRWDRRCCIANWTCCAAAMVLWSVLGRGTGCCSSARRRTGTNRIWSDASVSAN